MAEYAEVTDEQIAEMDRTTTLRMLVRAAFRLGQKAERRRQATADTTCPVCQDVFMAEDMVPLCTDCYETLGVHDRAEEGG